MTVCIQCSMRALVHGEPPPSFDETPEAHAARVHPDPVATRRERVELERALITRYQTPDDLARAFGRQREDPS